MTISFANLRPLLEKQTAHLEQGEKSTGFTGWFDEGVVVKMKAKMILTINATPKDQRGTGYDPRVFTATVTMTPFNEELQNIASEYFLNKKTSSSENGSERLFFSTVLINNECIIG